MENRDSKACASERGRKPTAPMLINHISRMFDERMRAILPAGHPMTQNSCRFIMGNLMQQHGLDEAAEYHQAMLEGRKHAEEAVGA